MLLPHAIIHLKLWNTCRVTLTRHYPEKSLETSNDTFPKTARYARRGQNLFQMSIHPLLSRINKRRYGWSVRGKTRASSVWGVYDPGELYWGLSCLRIFHGQHSRGLPGCFQGTGDYKQQLAAGTT